jgi:hypothetical protein
MRTHLNARVSISFSRGALLCFLWATANPFVSEAHFVERTAVPMMLNNARISHSGKFHPFKADVEDKTRFWQQCSSSRVLNDGRCVSGSVCAFVLHLRGGSHRGGPGLVGRRVDPHRTMPLHDEAKAWRDDAQEHMDNMEDDGMEEEELTAQQQEGLEILR